MQDKEKVYDEQIFPLMAKIIEVCKAHEIPMAATFQYCEDERCTSTLPFPHATTEMTAIQRAMQPRHAAFAMAITETDQEDGGKLISMRRIS